MRGFRTQYASQVRYPLRLFGKYLGDLIDNAPDSMAAIEHAFVELDAEGPRCSSGA